MNTQQTHFSVRVNKKDFLAKVMKSYPYYAKSSIHNANRLKTIINMVHISSDEFVTVTEDIYKLIYKFDS